jgi:hypothetical protein
MRTRVDILLKILGLYVRFEPQILLIKEEGVFLANRLYVHSTTPRSPSLNIYR